MVAPHNAIPRGHLDEDRRLVPNGADVNAVDSHRNTPLILAERNS